MGSGKYSSSQCNDYRKKSHLWLMKTVRTRHRTLKTTDRKWVILKAKVRYYRVRIHLWPLQGPLKSPFQSTSHAVRQDLPQPHLGFHWFVDHPRSRRNSTPVLSSYRNDGRKIIIQRNPMPKFGPDENNPSKKQKTAVTEVRVRRLDQMKSESSFSSRNRKATAVALLWTRTLTRQRGRWRRPYW
jgi:hypothetical protein